MFDELPARDVAAEPLRRHPSPILLIATRFNSARDIPDRPPTEDLSRTPDTITDNHHLKGYVMTHLIRRIVAIAAVGAASTGAVACGPISPGTVQPHPDTLVMCRGEYTELISSTGKTDFLPHDNQFFPGSPPCIKPNADPAPSCAKVCADLKQNDLLPVVDCQLTPVTTPNNCSTGSNRGRMVGPADPPTTPPTFSIVGTDLVTLTGSATVTAFGQTQTVGIQSGTFNFAAPDTSCTAGNTTACATQLNQITIAFDDFSLSDFGVRGLTLTLAQPTMTPAGFFDSSTGLFSFVLQSGVPFNANAVIDFPGMSTGVPAGALTSTQEPVFGSLDPSTGELTFQFNIDGAVNGDPVTIVGSPIDSGRRAGRAPKTPAS
jgi:hypothetical protein